MNIIKLESKYYDKWNEFYYKNKWFWNTTHWMEYIKNSKFETEYKNHSFFIEQNKQIIDIVYLIQENDKLISTGFNDNKKILEEINRIALENNIKYIQVNSDIKSYLNISGYTCILDLDNISPTKGHKSCIKKSKKYLEYEIMTETKQFMIDYFEIAGKVTRPEKTFELLEKWIKLGFGILLKAKYENDTAGYIYVLKCNNRAYYFMSATYTQYKQYNICHYLQSIVFEILKQEGIKYYELGDQDYNSLHFQPTEKEKNISKFKRGFGGHIAINHISEYFFSEEFFKETMNNRINIYIRSEYEND